MSEWDFERMKNKRVRDASVEARKALARKHQREFNELAAVSRAAPESDDSDSDPYLEKAKAKERSLMAADAIDPAAHAAIDPAAHAATPPRRTGRHIFPRAAHAANDPAAHAANDPAVDPAAIDSAVHAAFDPAPVADQAPVAGTEGFVGHAWVRDGFIELDDGREFDFDSKNGSTFGEVFGNASLLSASGKHVRGLVTVPKSLLPGRFLELSTEAGGPVGNAAGFRCWKIQSLRERDQ
jgi:hypothetical protein